MYSPLTAQPIAAFLLFFPEGKKYCQLPVRSTVFPLAQPHVAPLIYRNNYLKAPLHRHACIFQRTWCTCSEQRSEHMEKNHEKLRRNQFLCRFLEQLDDYAIKCAQYFLMNEGTESAQTKQEEKIEHFKDVCVLSA